jgi:hypothetical protein
MRGVAIKYLFSIGLAAILASVGSPGPAASAGPAAPPFPEDIMAQPVLRFFMDMMPGLGHQAHTALIMRRLREAGYKGRMEVVFYHPSVVEKMAALFPTYNPKHPQRVQTDTVNNIRYYQLNYSDMMEKMNPGDGSGNPAQLEMVKYAISGGNDTQMTIWPGFLPNRLRAQYLIAVNPPGWHIDSHVIFPSETLVKIEGQRDSSSRESTWLWTPDELDNRLIKKLKGLKDSFTVIPAYPSSAKDQLILSGILAAYARLPEKKTIVVPIAQNYRPEWQARFNQANKSFRPVYTWTTLDRIQPGKLNFVEVGSVAQPTFNAIFSGMDFPLAIVSGRNSVNIAALGGQALLASFSFDPKNPGEPFSTIDFANHPLWPEFIAAQHALLDPAKDIAALAKILEYALGGGEKLKPFFTELARVMREQDRIDHVEAGFAGAMEIIHKGDPGKGCDQIMNRKPVERPGRPNRPDRPFAEI